MTTISVNKVIESTTFRYLNGDCSSVEFGELLRAIIRDQARNLSQIAFSNLMNKFVVSGLDLLNYHDSKDVIKYKLAGLIIFDKLIDINDEIMPERRIEISNHIFKVLENDKLSLLSNEIVLRTAAASIGHFARVASSSEAEFLQNFSFPLALKLLLDIKSDSHKFSGALILTQLAQNSPTLIFSKQKQVLAEVCKIVSDKNPMVRASAAVALESVLKVIAQRESMADYIRSACKQVDSALNSNSSEKIIGGLIILDTVIGGSIISMTEVHSTMRQFGFHAQDLIWKVLSKKDSKDIDVKQNVLEMLPNLAKAFSSTFLQPNSYCSPNFLMYTVTFLIESITERKERNNAFVALGKLHLALSNHFRTSVQIQSVFDVICVGFKDPFSTDALDCLGIMVNISPAFRKLVEEKTVEFMFRGGLSKQLVESLKLVTKHVPVVRSFALRLLLREISTILNQKSGLSDEKRRLIDSKSAKEKQKWNSTSSHLFGGLKVEIAADSSLNATKTIDDLVFALEVLSESEFFPKYYRERILSGTEDDKTQDLLILLRDYVMKYLDDFNPLLRKAAALACATIINTVVLSVDPTKADFFLLHQTIERLLIMGVGDDSEEIRGLIFNSITPAMDEAISRTSYAHCLVEALNDESLNVRASAMTVLARVARFDTLHIMPVIRLEIRRLIFNLSVTQDHQVKQESVRILQSLVKGSDSLIVPYVDQMIDPLLLLLKDSSADVVAAALSTIGELAVASPECVREHLDTLAPRLIESLNDHTSVVKQETAVIAMGKLVSSFSIVTAEPYKKYNGLFEGLVRAAQNSEDRSLELRLQAIKTLGLLGAVDATVYQHHLVCINPARSAFSNTTAELLTDGIEEDLVQDFETLELDEMDSTSENEQKLSQIEKMYFSLIVSELMNILKDSSLAYFHLLAAGVAVKTIRILGAESAFRVDKVISGIFFRLYQTDAGNNIKEALLDHIITLIATLGSKMKKHNSQLIQLIKDFFDSQCQLCLDILEAMGISYSTPDFNVILNEIVPFLAKCIEVELTAIQSGVHEDSANDSNSLPNKGTSAFQRAPFTSSRISTAIPKILQKFVNLNEYLGSFRREVIPLILSVLDHPYINAELRKDALLCLLNVATDKELQEFSGRVIRPILRLVNCADVRIQQVIVTAFSSIVCRLGSGYIPYIVPVKRKLGNLSILRDGSGKFPKLEEYESLISRLLKQRPLPPEPSDTSLISMKNDEKIKLRLQNTKSNTETNFQINVPSLETAWALADRNSASNLIEWMSRFTNELIRQSPSSIIRSCAVLANTYRPLAEELFNISFYCVWNELFASQMSEVVVDASLISGIEMALQSPEVPKPIMISLLNLTEFMDIHDLPLPIDIRILAFQAQSANMFAKCLRYRELEFQSKNVKPSFECIDALITVCNQLGLVDRAIGVLRYLKQEFSDVEIQPQWLEKLCRWEEAQKAYEHGVTHFRLLYQNENFPSKHEQWMNAELGRLRCLHALGEYEDVLSESKALRAQIKLGDEVQDVNYWNSLAEVQRLGSYAAWMLGKWDTMEELLEGETRSSDTKDVVLWNHLSFFKAILAIHQQDYSRASIGINEIRNTLSNSITSLLSESYARAYRAMVTMQILAEMEEIVEFKQMTERLSLEHDTLTEKEIRSDFLPSETKLNSGANIDINAKKVALISKWRGRLKWAPKDIEVYRQILAVHTLVTEPLEDLDSWLELVTMCRKEGMYSLCFNLLRKLGAPLPSRKSDQLQVDLNTTSKSNEKVLLSTYQYWWSFGEKERALTELTSFLRSCALPDSLSSVGNNYNHRDATMFRVKCLLKRATWMRELEKGDVNEILETLLEARDLAKDEYSVWHAWAVANYDQLRKAGSVDRKVSFDAESSAVPYIPVFISPQSSNVNNKAPSSAQKAEKPGAGLANRFNYVTPKKLASSSGSVSLLNLLSIQQTDKVTTFVVEAIKGFVKSIILGQGQPLANLLQDTLRLLTLWFSYGSKKGVLVILESELEKISSDNWLSVIPQLIARIHVKSAEISGLLRKLLVKVAAVHPQALVWPISVALNTNDGQQRVVANEILSEMKKNKRQLVEEATIVSKELMKVAITPHELWYDGLEQAAQFYMDNKDIPSMVNVLTDLHETMNEQSWPENKKDGFGEGLGKIGSVSMRDVSFRHAFAKSLQDALFWLEQFRSSGRTVDLHQAWEIYQTIFKKIKAQIVSLKKLELDHVSPALFAAKTLSLAVPGTYKPNSTDILINSFSANVHVIASKQRPRRISMLGSDGRKYQFLLKGHEDLRQDERVMQLFGLINACLNYDRITNDRGLNIVRYSVLPLSNNSGVIGWVENCDTINQLIKHYREENDIRLLTEMRLLQSKSRNYDKLPLIHKVDLFRQVLNETSGEDLAKMLWLKSQTSDIWIERRANFTKSLAVMSMAGYILGLGDRHPSNLMIHRMSGQVVHIDFGDCFEITANRSKYPEIIPFRLTRMLTNCMGVAGIQGTYRLTCERVMRVLRDNRDSVMAMLEAFVYDPLISWRLLGKGDDTEMKLVSRVNTVDEDLEQSTTEKLRDQLSTLAGTEKDQSQLGDLSAQNDLSPKKHLGVSLRDPPILRRSKSQEGNPEEEPFQENVNTRALEVINRIQAKLTGRDFLKYDETGEDFTVEQQVDRLIKEATSIENLCQLFSGWCPLW